MFLRRPGYGRPATPLPRRSRVAARDPTVSLAMERLSQASPCRGAVARSRSGGCTCDTTPGSASSIAGRKRRHLKFPAIIAGFEPREQELALESVPAIAASGCVFADADETAAATVAAAVPANASATAPTAAASASRVNLRILLPFLVRVCSLTFVACRDGFGRPGKGYLTQSWSSRMPHCMLYW